ncbi:hypothetical protein EYF80_044433 [Liparis tanakae]|uniref:Uncharacterized protein n=1 Tax=Liparis tanakae TaxID=230148 RepID=A0A4Z2FVV6_9TELE|nr:hypothetical protein EYF80_044433 [Liparis tanakae]
MKHGSRRACRKRDSRVGGGGGGGGGGERKQRGGGRAEKIGKEREKRERRERRVDTQRQRRETMTTGESAGLDRRGGPQKERHNAASYSLLIVGKRKASVRPPADIKTFSDKL